MHSVLKILLDSEKLSHPFVLKGPFGTFWSASCLGASSGTSWMTIGIETIPSSSSGIVEMSESVGLRMPMDMAGEEEGEEELTVPTESPPGISSSDYGRGGKI